MSDNKLNTIPQEGTWGTAATLLNHNFAAIEQEITTLLNSTIKEKGYFTSLESLKVAYPIVPEGSVAYIGTSSPFKLYRYYMGTWQDTGLTGGPDGVNVTDFYNKSEINTLTLGEYNSKVYVYLNGVRLGNGISISGGGGSGGSDSEEEEIPDVVTVLGDISLVEGGAADYSATVTPIQKDVTWSISGGKGNDTINANGRLITDGMYGSDRTITVKATTDSGYYGTKKVTVKKKVFPTSVDIVQTGSGGLGATYKAVLNEGVNQAYTTKWSISGSDKVTLSQSSDQDVCSVTFLTEATVTFTLTVTITGNFTTLTYSETFTRDGEATGITITPESAQVVEGDTLDFDAIVYPDNEEVVWSIGSGSGCSIDEETGVLTTVEGDGARTIIVKADTVSGSASAERIVVVQQAIRPTQITINGPTNITSASTYTLNVQPENINREYTVVWNLTGSAVNNGYVSRGSYSNTQCTVNVATNRDSSSAFQLTATITQGFKVLTNSITVQVPSSQSSPTVSATVLQINQSILDPQAILAVTGDKAQLNAIRSNSHRYLGKCVNGVMHLCQLSDSTPNIYHMNSAAAPIDGNGGDVFMKLPAFYYKSVQVDADVWNIMFNYDGIGIDDTWSRWDGKDLIGAYRAFNDGSRLRSISGETPTTRLSRDQYRALASDARHANFSLVKWKHHCMMAILFYAMYETTNSQARIGSGINAFSAVTGTAAVGSMVDTDASTKPENTPISFWGLEAWWGGEYELLDNVVVNRTTANGVWTITEDDGSMREVAAATSGTYISKMHFGAHLDLIPTECLGTATTGYCDAYQRSTNTNSPVRRSNQSNTDAAGIAACGHLGNVNTVNGYNETRLAYRGDFILDAPATFNDITNWV